jgi:7-cyano-7-deazaguanine synthase
MPHPQPTIGVLTSGGLDSAILVSHLAEQGEIVQPIYLESGLHWQPAELAGLQAYLQAAATKNLLPLVVLKLPLDDVYTDHWSLTGKQTPDATTPDEAVYLPGRNLLLSIKPAIWCQLHGIKKLALGVLGSNPFDDASDAFFTALESVLAKLGQPPLEIVRPFGKLHKREVMLLGRDFPLALSFSCIAPVGNLHCGRCNKCAERKAAFASAGLPDDTRYAD